jgi:hypothetical protein
MHEAFLIGIWQYPDHTLAGVSNDLALLARGLQHRNYSPSAIHVFDDTHKTQAQLRELLAQIGARYADVDQGSCYLHIGASGALSLEPLAGGILPSDGNLTDWSTILPFASLNDYLPGREGMRVTMTLET